MLKVGVQLDGVLADSEKRLSLYAKTFQLDPNLYQAKLLSDESFWWGMNEFTDVSFFIKALAAIDAELFILSKRPESLFFITRSWLKRKRISYLDDHIITNSLYRFDCRINDIDIFIGTDSVELEKFSYDRVQAIQICRKDHSEADHRSQDLSYPVIHNLEKALNYHAKMQSPWI